MLARSLSRHVGNSSGCCSVKSSTGFRGIFTCCPFVKTCTPCQLRRPTAAPDCRSLSASGYCANQSPRAAPPPISQQTAAPGRSRLLHVAAHYVIGFALEDDACQSSSVAAARHVAADSHSPAYVSIRAAGTITRLSTTIGASRDALNNCPAWFVSNRCCRSFEPSQSYWPTR